MVWILMATLSASNIFSLFVSVSLPAVHLSMFDYASIHFIFITQVSPVAAVFLFWSDIPVHLSKSPADVPCSLLLLLLLSCCLSLLNFNSSFNLSHFAVHTIQFPRFGAFRTLPCFTDVRLMFHSVSHSVVPLDLLFCLFSFFYLRCFIFIIFFFFLLLHFLSLPIKCKELSSSRLIEHSVQYCLCSHSLIIY